MSVAAIVGAGPIGAAIVHRLAESGDIREIRWIDPAVSVAAGKALDIQQAGAIGPFDARIDVSADALSAAGADVIVLADDVADGEWRGAPALALVERLARSGTAAAFVFAGPNGTWLMEAAARELKIAANRLVGTAPAALASALRAFATIELGLPAIDCDVLGRPPAFVVAWSAARAGGALVTDQAPAHRLLQISASLPKLWPPGPQTTGAATAPIVRALVQDSRRPHLASTLIDGEFGVRGAAVLLPLWLAGNRVRSHAAPSLSPQERTELLNSVSRVGETSV